MIFQSSEQSQLGHPKIEDAYRKIIQICNRPGVAPGIHLADMELTKKWMRKGMRLVTYSYDSKFFKASSTQALNELRNHNLEFGSQRSPTA